MYVWHTGCTQSGVWSAGSTSRTGAVCIPLHRLHCLAGVGQYIHVHVHVHMKGGSKVTLICTHEGERAWKSRLVYMNTCTLYVHVCIVSV